jgi:hypothetical protein
VLNPLVSLVREAPSLARSFPPSAQGQRMVVAGAYWPDWPEGKDYWQFVEEYRRVTKPLEAMRQQIDPDPAVDAAREGIPKALSHPAAVFHYAGHTDVVGGRGYLAREVYTDPGRKEIKPQYRTEFLGRTLWFDPLFADELGDRLRNAETRLAVFSACNSGRWPFVEPLLRGGLPALIGTQGLISTRAAALFCSKFYSLLALGFSLDEAVRGARFDLLEAALADDGETCEWGTFMVYMPSTTSVLFPAPDSPATLERQVTARNQVAKTIYNIVQNIRSVAPGGVVQGVDNTNSGAAAPPAERAAPAAPIPDGEAAGPRP